MTCPNCGHQAEPDERIREWTVCLACTSILVLDQSGDPVKRNTLHTATPEEFLALVQNTQSYGMLLLLQDEIRAMHDQGHGQGFG